ncbi:hypothetical protein DNI29_04490 [Hymenobacter sediminis]|uniref:hypothetical protein n=1 Tax=Hymenobacter sediminis TaxID=2218621 RepID=UPI000DA6B5E1|nr:hypothetical protein [Hymenobacter sediminis]RPD50061.1 hypothetical protein DNI29_04490 [Hymenobacter sediminis]
MLLLLFTFLLTSDALPAYQLETDPIGWDSLRYVLQRDEQYHGVTLEMSTDLTFVKKGADYLRTLYEGKGVEAVAHLSVYQHNPNEFRADLAAYQRVDFTQYSSSARGVSVKLKEVGFTTKFLNRDSTDVELQRGESVEGVALPPLEPIELQMHSQVLTQQYQAPKKDSFIPTAGENYVMDGESRFQTILFGFGTPEVDEFNIGVMASGAFTVEKDSGTARPHFFTAAANGKFTLSFKLRSSLLIEQGDDQPFPLKTPSFEKVDISYYMRVNEEIVATLGSFSNSVDKGQDYRRTFDKDFTQVLDLKAGDKVYLYADLHVYDITPNDPILGYYSFKVTPKVLKGSELTIKASTTTEPTPAKGLLVYEAIERTLQSITDTPGAVLYSEYFGRPELGYKADGPGALTFITSGFALRGFPLADKPLTCSFEDLYASLDAVECLGVGIEHRNGREVVRVENRRYFYQDTVVLTLGRVADLRKACHPSLLYNQAQVGYTRWESGAPNGLAEFNGQRSYALPISQVSTSYNALSPYSAAGCLIEETRRQPYVSTQQKEGQADSNNFLIRLRRAPDGTLATERAEAFSLVEGTLAADSAYNLRITPARNLHRHGAWLRAGLLHREDRKLQRTATQGNDELSSQLNGEAEPIAERADVLVEDLPAPYVLAETYEFTWRLTLSELAQLRRNPYGLIRFRDESGRLKAGYLLKADRTPVSGKTSFTLLRAATV